MPFFSFDHFLCICTFSEILMSNNSSIGIFPYSYILCLDRILLDGIFMDFKLIYVVTSDHVIHLLLYALVLVSLA